MNNKITYTPFISYVGDYLNDIRLPESNYLQPIKLAQNIEIQSDNKFDNKSESKGVLKTDAKSNTSSLTWARNKIQNNSSIPEDDLIDEDEIKRRQRWAESADDPSAVSKVGAKGLYQIMDAANKDYILATGDVGDLFDPSYNEKNRDWYWDKLGKSKTVSNGNPNKKVKIAKQLAAYNWGIGNLGTYLEEQKSKGVDIYQSLDWINGLPKETRQYIGRILLKEDEKWEESYKNRPKIRAYN